MSITFWAPSAPCVETTVACEFCDGVGISPWGACRYCRETGEAKETRSTLPEINMSNQNARDFLKQLGEQESCGTWEVDRLKLLEPTLLLLSLGVNAPAFERETAVHGNFIDCGRDSDYVKRRSMQMLELVREAIKGNYDVSWG